MDAIAVSFRKVMAEKEKSRQIFEDIKTVAEAKRAEARPAPKVDPQTDNAAKAELAGASGATLKKGLIAGAAENPSIVAGIEATDMMDVITGAKDFFANAKKFTTDKLQEAATATSEKSKDLAIGGAIVGALTAAYTMGKDVGLEAGKIVREQIAKALDGTDVDEKVKQKLETMTPQSVKDGVENAKLIMNDALMREIAISRTKKAIEEAVANIKTNAIEIAKPIFDSTKDLETRVVDLKKRKEEAWVRIEKALDDVDFGKLKPGKEVVLDDDGKGNRFTMTAN